MKGASMRDILFKAKRIDNGEWVEGGYSYCEKDDTHFITQMSKDHISYIGRHQQIEPNTLCQYTGLTDKNVNKIWENDVVRDTEEDMTMVVRWDDEELRFVLDDYGYKGCVMEYGFDEFAGGFGVVDTYGFNDFCKTVDKFIEVIGNIFDNVELLEG